MGYASGYITGVDNSEIKRAGDHEIGMAVCRRLTQTVATNVPFCDQVRLLPEWTRVIDRAVAHGMRKRVA
ncbi:hypothetical protein QY702_01570 [Xanthomonas campestris pv. plantaginis]|uniref:hypothetical protein n=1 Tax=Xanthomonas campestris TaxID=339 RepID=UPI002B2266BC|nr:hypothetical protein [Xanthomonas campestris]MEA9605163.1 hypothetical protein [Xanthomonas campestris pv. plantaginis]